MAENPIASVLGDPHKRATAAQILGQAYVKAYNLMTQNKKAVEQIADTLVERKELYGNELVALLEGAKLKEPRIDLSKETAWPTI
jgi:ATP-dependent Zn protease